MRTTLHSVKLVIIDEVSMVSNLTLAYIHLRIDEFFGGVHAHQRCWGSDYDWFGAVNMLFVGDLLQLPPVNGLPVFCKLKNEVIATKIGSIAAPNIWMDCVTYDELTINQRQKDDPVYTKVFRKPSKETLDLLSQRVINESVTQIFQKLSGTGHSPVCLFPHVKHVKIITGKCLLPLMPKLKPFHVLMK